MKYKYDLHIHSNFSPDGELSPSEIMEKAQRMGLGAAVIADHNMINSFGPAIRAAKKYDIWTCEGVEISTKFKKIDVHILGYSLKFNQSILKRGLKETIAGFEERSKIYAQKLSKLGVANIDFARVKQRLKDSYVSKPNVIQEAASKAGLSFKEVEVLTLRGGPAYVPYGKWAMSPLEAVELIIKTNGLAVLAHPGDFSKRSSFSPKETELILVELVDSLTKRGLKGIEAVYPKHSHSQNLKFKAWAKSKGLIITGGSDWHGKDVTPDYEIGEAGVNREEFLIFKEAIEKAL